MCTDRQEINGFMVACRRCDACLQTRKNDWVARCMAENETAAETFLFTLTYRNNKDGSTPVAAKVFNYRHVQLFMKKLREQYKRDYGHRAELRYVVCGETGSKKGRVHWHMIIWTERPICTLGEWFNMAWKKLTRFKFDTRIHWSMWPHGHVYVQQPDEGGCLYVLKYAFKDQFNVVKAKGTKREHKSERFSAAMFRMSKTPPIGQRWLDMKIKSWTDRRVLPVSLNLKPKGLKGYWFPRGDLRKQLCVALHEINEKCNEVYGRDCAQWSALLSSVEQPDPENERLTDWDILKHGEIEFKETTGYFPGAAFGATDVERNRKHARQWARKNHLARKCGNIIPCAGCFAKLSFDDQNAAINYEFDQRQAFKWLKDHKGVVHSKARFFREWRQRGLVSHWCQNDRPGEVEQACKDVARVARANREGPWKNM
jgi:hypothetical protein